MAINQPTKLASQFWHDFIRKQVIATILLSVLISGIIVFFLIYTKTVSPSSVIFWIIVIALIALSVAVNLFLTSVAISPAKTLLAAVINISGEHSNLTPPNPNTNNKKNNQLGDALKTIYELASQKNDQDADTQQSKDSAPIINAVNMSRCGFIALDKTRKIIYSNTSAPITIKSDGSKQISLLFDGNDDLTHWLDDCSQNAVRADHVWTRIPNKLPNEGDRRFFDVIASYRKDLEPETVLVLIDRTAIYSVDEEDLDFIAFAAHELRGPITVIKGYVEILQDELSDSLKGDQIELFNRLAISSNRLSGYIDNILNTSRYDRRHLKINMTEDTIANVYDMIADDMKLRANSQNRLLNVNIPNDLPTVAVDKASMSEVLSNLIDNAIKYSNEGGVVTVTAKVNGDFVDVSVQDNGIGMPESVVSNLFKKFYRSHRSRETVAGTGIGLYISKAIVESHGGTISVRSRDGYGSTFTASIPIYATVADKLKTVNNSNESLISTGTGWIKNHSMYRG